MIKIEHSIFALPYAWTGSFLAAKGLPPAVALVSLTVAMVAVRSFAMAFNRMVDLPFDASNPRTACRPLVTGAISMGQTRLFCLTTALIFIAACATLNMTCVALAVPAIFFAGAYSFLKRVSPICHYWLGATLGLSPLAGWLAVSPENMSLAPILLFFAVTFWVGAFDIYYSFQDIDFDQKVGLHSMPANFGRETALAIAGFSHIITIIFLFLTGLAANLGWPWYAVCVGIAIMLWAEHRLMLPKDLRHINTAFFTINGIISPVVLIGVILGIYY